MRRGFKAQAERISLSARKELKVGPRAALDPWSYATHVGVLVLEFADLGLSARSQRRLIESDKESWSGMTIKEGPTTAILVNPAHVRPRQCSTLAHELSHILLKHVPNSVQVSPTGLLLLSDYSDEQEAEADWLGAALLIPREAMMFYRARGETVEQIAKRYGVSEPLCEWRRRTTGVDIQIGRRPPPS